MTQFKRLTVTKEHYEEINWPINSIISSLVGDFYIKENNTTHEK